MTRTNTAGSERTFSSAAQTSHVNTQLPYALVVAAVSFVAYAIAPFVGTPWISLPIAVLLLLATLFFIKLVLKGPAFGADDAIAHKVRQVQN